MARAQLPDVAPPRRPCPVTQHCAYLNHAAACVSLHCYNTEEESLGVGGDAGERLETALTGTGDDDK